MAITSLSGLVPLRQYVQEFNSSGTWTCPFGTTQVELLLVGGGGGGGSATALNANHMAAGGGGGGGEVNKTSVAVTAGTTYTVTVGAGGSGSTATTASGGSGGDTSFGLTRTIANAHWYNHEYAIHLAAYSNNATNTAAFTQPGGWFQKYQGSGYSLASPPAYTLANSTNPTMAYHISYYVSNAAMTTPGVPSGFNGYSYATSGIASVTSYTDLCNWVPVTASTQYTASASVYANGSPSTAIRIEWYQAFQGTFISASTSTTSTANLTWTQQTVTATSPANATFALVRYQCVGNGANSPYASWVNQQFEPGAAVTSYKGPFTSKTWTQTGISNVITGAVASGGGGGSSVNPNGTGTVAGIGGGSASFSTSGGNASVFGGAGSGMGSPVVMSTFRGGYNIQTGYSVGGGTPTQVPPAHPVTGRGGSGTTWNYSNVSPSVSAGSASYGVDGYGGGGAGGLASLQPITPIEPYFVSGSAGTGGLATANQASGGSPAVANSGCGGGGGAVGYLTAGSPADAGRGGNGGSGKVIITYWGY